MKPTDIESRVGWDAYGQGSIVLAVGLFGAELTFTLNPADGAALTVTPKMAQTIADVLALTPAHLPVIKQMLWDEANFAFSTVDYGVQPMRGETHLEAHSRAFGIANPDDAFAKSAVLGVQIVDEFSARFAELKIDTGTDNLISIIIKDGRIIDWDHDGTYLGWFENDESSAAKRRAGTRGG